MFTSKCESTDTNVSIATTNDDQAFWHYCLINISPPGSCTDARGLPVLGDYDGAEVSKIDGDAILDVRRIVKGSVSAAFDSERALSQLVDDYCC